MLECDSCECVCVCVTVKVWRPLHVPRSSSYVTRTIVALKPPTVTVMALTHVAGAHTHCSPAVLGAMVLIEYTEASHWLLADVQQPITAVRSERQRYREQNILQAAAAYVWVSFKGAIL